MGHPLEYRRGLLLIHTAGEKVHRIATSARERRVIDESQIVAEPIDEATQGAPFFR